MAYELGNPEWITTARSFLAALASANADEAIGLLAPEVTYRVLGHHALSGEFSGRDAAMDHLAAIVRETDGRFDPIKFEDWMLGLSHVSVLVDVHVEVGTATGRLRHLILMRFSLADLIDEVLVFFADPEAAERLYGHLLPDDPSHETR